MKMKIDMARRAHRCDAGVPLARAERDSLARQVGEYVAGNQLLPPISIDELRRHSGIVCKKHKIDRHHADFVSVLLGNTIWRDTVSTVPFDRRVFMIPHCLRDKDRCPAEMDQFGLLCRQCGRCVIGELKKEAEALGYLVLVAEGTTVVTSLIEGGRIDAVIGIGCISSLEKTFPHIAMNAVPGLAVPLLRDGCMNTSVDADWAVEMLHLKSEGCQIRHLDYPALQRELSSWFTVENLGKRFGHGSSVVEKAAIAYLARAGKRWRPFILAATHKALSSSSSDKTPDVVKTLALSVECFHKASLIHDDIEDGDRFRDGERTLHSELGLPVALNIGDFLVGEGYRLIAECNLPAELKETLLRIVSRGHRNLCVGQGMELSWGLSSRIPTARDLVEIARLKTAPAFEVAFLLGAMTAGADGRTCAALSEFSSHLGVAYQISDDIKDASHKVKRRPELSINLAVAWELARGKERKIIADAWSGHRPRNGNSTVGKLIRSKKVMEKVGGILQRHRNLAISSANAADNIALKTFLFRIIGRIVKADEGKKSK